MQSNFRQMPCWFPKAIITDSLSGLQGRTIASLSAAVQKSNIKVLPRSFRRDLCCLPSPGNITPVSASVFTQPFPLCLSQTPSPPFLIRIPATGFRQIHFEILTSAKTLFPNKARHSTRRQGWTYILGGCDLTTDAEKGSQGDSESWSSVEVEAIRKGC